MPAAVPRRLPGARALGALASPARLEIIEHLQTHGASSVAELAAALGRAPDALYYHLRELEATGFVSADGAAPRRGPGRAGAVIHLTAPDFQLGTEGGWRAERRARSRAVGALLRQTLREFEAAHAAPRAGRAGEHNGGRKELRRPPGRAARVKAWLSPEDLARVERLLGQLNRLLGRCHVHLEGRELHAFTYVLVPLQPKTRRNP